MTYRTEYRIQQWDSQAGIWVTLDLLTNSRLTGYFLLVFPVYSDIEPERQFRTALHNKALKYMETHTTIRIVENWPDSEFPDAYTTVWSNGRWT